MVDSTKLYLSAGDRAPVCMGITADGSVYASEAQSGRAVVMILAPNLGAPGLEGLLHAFSAQAERLGELEVDLVALVDDDVDRVVEFSHKHPGRVTLIGALNDYLRRNGLEGRVPQVLTTSPHEFLQRIGFSSETPEVLIIDRNQRISGRIGYSEVDRVVSLTMAVVDLLPVEAARDIVAPAPVLILPNLLDASLCRELVEMHKTGSATDSPSLTFDAEGHPGHKIDHRLKRRHDLLLEREHPMSVRITDILKRRCIPEIKRSFQYDVSHTDRYNIACYPSEGGHFRRHRDNRPELVAFRRFALSINLTSSAEGYEGGFLRLPEFNSHHYRVPTGGGVIFSVALLHEITPVVKGNRYVLVTHLHDDEGEERWKEMRRVLGNAA
jgi:hypothetical protein